MLHFRPQVIIRCRVPFQRKSSLDPGRLEIACDGDKRLARMLLQRYAQLLRFRYLGTNPRQNNIAFQNIAPNLQTGSQRIQFTTHTPSRSTPGLSAMDRTLPLPKQPYNPSFGSDGFRQGSPRSTPGRLAIRGATTLDWPKVRGLSLNSDGVGEK